MFVMAVLTVRQAGERLGVSYSTLKQWIYKGNVRTTRTEGGHHRIAEAEVERLMSRAGQAPRRTHRTRGGGVLMMVSGRNRLRGVVEEVRREGLVAQVRLRIGDQSLTAVITRDALDELRLKRGDEATALVKATEVMVAKEVLPEVEPASARRRA
jgi:molybdopterin-binding protein